jgi:hypothetical protein
VAVYDTQTGTVVDYDSTQTLVKYEIVTTVLMTGWLDGTTTVSSTYTVTSVDLTESQV